MKSTLNVLELGLGAVICAALLSACDGRGITQMKAVSYTPEQLAAHKLERDGKARPAPQEDQVAANPLTTPNSDGNTLNPPASSLVSTNTNTTPGVNPPADPKKTPPDDGSTEGNQPPAQTPVDTGNKQNTVFVEFEKLVDTVNSKIHTKDDDAVNVVKGIDIKVTPGSSSLMLSIDGVIELNKQARYLFVDVTPIGYNENNQVNALKIDLANMDLSGRGPADPTTVVGYGFCGDKDCQAVYVILDFGYTNDKRATAVFKLQMSDTTKKYEIVESNLGDQLKTRKQAEDLIAKSSIKSPQDAADAAHAPAVDNKPTTQTQTSAQPLLHPGQSLTADPSKTANTQTTPAAKPVIKSPQDAADAAHAPAVNNKPAAQTQTTTSAQPLLHPGQSLTADPSKTANTQTTPAAKPVIKSPQDAADAAHALPANNKPATQTQTSAQPLLHPGQSLTADPSKTASVNTQTAPAAKPAIKSPQDAADAAHAPAAKQAATSTTTSVSQDSVASLKKKDTTSKDSSVLDTLENMLFTPAQ